MTPLLLDASGITKTYPGVRALKGVSFNLRPGEIHALIGENGAGKSTLIKILTGAVIPDSGQIVVDGKTVEHHTPARARELGIAAIYQHPALFPDLTVAENLALRDERGSAWTRVKWNTRRRKARELFEQIGAMIDPDAHVSELSMPE